MRLVDAASAMSSDRAGCGAQPLDPAADLLRVGLPGRAIDDQARRHVRDTGDQEIYKFILSMTPFRRIIKEYFDVCESYFAAIKASSLSQIEAIDMGRRGLHNEGSEILRDRLAGKVEMDFGTARRLFTLICALHMKT